VFELDFKNLISIIVMCFVFSIILPSAFSESNISDFGFKGISIKENSSSCEQFILPLEKSNLTPILSIKALFSSVMNDDSKISVSFDGVNTQTFLASDFLCTENINCVIRIFVPKTDANTTNVSICAISGPLTNNLLVLKESKFGFYDSPWLSIENTVSPSINLGEQAKMSIVVTNSGTKQSDIFVQFIRPSVRTDVDIDSFDIVSGESQARAVILPGAEREFVYYIKPTKESTYNLSNSILFFDNIFGERQSIKSNYSRLVVLNENYLKVTSILETDTNNVLLKVILTNNLPSTYTGHLQVYPKNYFSNSELNVSVPAEAEMDYVFTLPLSEATNATFFAEVIDSNFLNSSALDLNTIDSNLSDSNTSVDSNKLTDSNFDNIGKILYNSSSLEKNHFSNKIVFTSPVPQNDFGMIFAIISLLVAGAIFAGFYLYNEKK
jgi:hypothetical protein